MLYNELEEYNLKKYCVTFFEKEDGVFPAEDFIRSLDYKMMAKVYRLIDMISENGPELREPYSKHLEDGIFELRAQLGSNVSRVLYFFVVGKRIILTNGFIKKTQKTPRGEINKAKVYRREYLSRKENDYENI
jgi:phage-related protein